MSILEGKKFKLLSSFAAKHSPTLLGLFATAIYLITMDCSISWWDCGEFITTNYTLGVGHPPGAPFYQLLAHLLTLLSFGNSNLIAPLSNSLSAISAGITVALLYMTINALGARRRGAAIGALCYLFTDTAWFSAVESEVYALAMLFCSLNLYLTVRWSITHNHRLLPLIALITGLGVCVHFMTLLSLPAMLFIAIKTRKAKPKNLVATISLSAAFFFIGLTPYAIVPIRAASNPVINEIGNGFISYIRRDQYSKAPLYPRMWREKDEKNWSNWTFSNHGLFANAAYFITYQATYMYGRYLMYNFAGRLNLKHNIPIFFILPALLGLLGLYYQRKHYRASYWVTMLLFLFGGIFLNIYLNHPCYEPRERDYVYVLSFYAFSIWIGFGADNIASMMKHRWLPLLLLSPTTLALGNWSDHNRHSIHSVHDISMAHLNSCDEGAILITLGDNDTFPLWYLQTIEQKRTDIDIYNINLTGFQNTINIIFENIDKRPIYFSQYFYTRYSSLFEGSLRCEGLCWHLIQNNEDINNTEALKRHFNNIEWNIKKGEYIDHVSSQLLRSWNINTSVLNNNQSSSPSSTDVD